MGLGFILAQNEAVKFGRTLGLRAIFVRAFERLQACTPKVVLLGLGNRLRNPGQNL